MEFSLPLGEGWGGVVFFRLSPAAYVGLHNRYEALLAGEHRCALSAKKIDPKQQEQLRAAFKSMMKGLFRQKGASLDINIITSKEAQAFIETHADVLNSAFEQTKMSSTMRDSLEHSTYIFSGLKTFHELNEAFPALVDEQGNKKPFERFLNDVQKVDKTYNEHYLRAEYNFTHAAADMAAKWEEFAEDGDRYNLQYRTVGDDHVRPEHAALNGTTLPFSDAFWDNYYPPNGWNCRCTVVQVRKTKYPETPREEAYRRGAEALANDTRGMFRFNPGKQGKAMPDYNPYSIRRCNDCDLAKGKTNLAFVPENELCAACSLIRLSQQSGKSQKLTPQEFREASNKAIQWAENNLTPTVINNQPAKRSLVQTADGHVIGVGKKFFSETAAKAIHDPDVVHVLKTATEFNEWLPQATLVRTEQGRHHNCMFSVYHVVYQGQTIEFKCKMTDGELLYMMKFI